MIKKKVIGLLKWVLTLNLVYNVCNKFDVGYKDVSEIIDKNDNESYISVIGPLPYYNSEHYPQEVKRFYKFIDLLDEKKQLTYTSINKNKQNKLAVKLTFFKKDGKIQFDKLKDIVDYASKKNIIIGIAAMHQEDKDDELETYIKLKKMGYNNLFITLAAYHKDIDIKVDKILELGGSIRLVKGWYNDGEISNWKEVSNNYLRNAIKLVKDNNYHILATHDFIILNKLYSSYYEWMDNKEVSFFIFNKDYIEKQLAIFPYKIKNISLYKPYGKTILRLIYSFFNIDLLREFKRRNLGYVS